MSNSIHVFKFGPYSVGVALFFPHRVVETVNSTTFRGHHHNQPLLNHTIMKKINSNAFPLWPFLAMAGCKNAKMGTLNMDGNPKKKRGKKNNYK